MHYGGGERRTQTCATAALRVGLRPVDRTEAADLIIGSAAYHQRMDPEWLQRISSLSDIGGVMGRAAGKERV